MTPFYLSYSTVAIIFFFARVLVGIIAGRLVFVNACRKVGVTFAIPPFWWGIVVFVEPAVGLLAYWVIHYSAIAPRREGQDEGHEA